MDQDYKIMDKISEELGRRMARFDTPEKIEFMQNEIEQAILALSNLFGLKAQELASIDMPEFEFCNYYDGYNLLLNEISMDPEGITLYRIGAVAGEFLYYATNPEIFYQKEEVCSAHIRSLGQANPLPSHDRYFRLGNAYINLVTVVEHYCGLFLGQDCCSAPDDPSELIAPLDFLPEDSDEHRLAKINASAHYRGMVIAERLFRNYPMEKFKSIVRLTFEEAKARLFYMTGIELLEEDE
jgi:hypothetical protein